MTEIIEIKELTKQYAGRRDQKAVDDLTLSVEEGAIFGFVGPNGAGKTSTLRMMATLLQPTRGDIRIAGHSVNKDPRSVRKVIGYMPDFFGVYNDMLVWEYLDFFGACYNIPAAQRSQLVSDLLELVDLTHRREDPVEGLSRGMKQRLSLARTLIHDPQLLILDEPASGLDPRARIEIRELMVELAKMGKTIFFSTHILADVAEICTQVAIIEAGKLVAAGALEELQRLLVPNRLVQLTTLSDVNYVHSILEANPLITNIQNLPGQLGRSRLQFGFMGDDLELSALLKTLFEQGVNLLNFSEDSRDLEEVFMRATKGLVT
jgi:ABC-2 type transport system ATP-binding protein